MRLQSLIVLLACLVPVLPAQIVGVRLADEKLERKYKKYLTKMNGRYYVVGERKSGFEYKGNGITITGKEEIELFVVDQSKPERVPYKYDSSGELVVTNKKGVVAIKRAHLPKEGAITYLMRSQTISGLASEYALKSEALERVRSRRDEHRKATSEWFKAQRELINGMQRLQGWLEVNSFIRAAQKYEKSVAKELKTMKEDAVAERYATAKESVRKIDVPQEILDAAEANNCASNLIAYESQHLRLVMCSVNITDEATRKLIELGEYIIEGFRREVIDPYVQDEDGFEDNTPDGLFSEFIYVPFEVGIYERFYEAIGGNWGKDKQRSLTMSGHPQRGLRGVSYHDYWRARDEMDFEGSLSHRLGHILANIHFNRNGSGSPQDWLAEATGYYTSFEFLGRNTVTCHAFKEDSYGRAKTKEGEKTLQQGQRALFNELALKKGIAIADLVRRDLADLDDADFAKSWSLLDYILHEEGRKGVEWLRACCAHGRDKNTVVAELLVATREVFGLADSVNSLDWIEERWRTYAKSGQDKGDSHRGGR